MNNAIARDAHVDLVEPGPASAGPDKPVIKFRKRLFGHPAPFKTRGQVNRRILASRIADGHEFALHATKGCRVRRAAQ